MKFTFGPIHRFSIWLYIPGAPILFFTIFDHLSSDPWIEETLRVQLFIIGMIMVLLASIINLSHHVISMLRDTLKPQPARRDKDSH